jgi:hypothetical protein
LGLTKLVTLTGGHVVTAHLCLQPRLILDAITMQDLETVILAVHNVLDGAQFRQEVMATSYYWY